MVQVFNQAIKIYASYKHVYPVNGSKTYKISAFGIGKLVIKAHA